MASLNCPTCGEHRSDVPDSYIGKTVKCKKCGESVRIGGEESPQEPIPPAPKKPPPSTPRPSQPRPLWPFSDEETVLIRRMIHDAAYNHRAIRTMIVVGRWALMGLFILAVVSVIYNAMMRKAMQGL